MDYLIVLYTVLLPFCFWFNLGEGGVFKRMIDATVLCLAIELLVVCIPFVGASWFILRFVLKRL